MGISEVKGVGFGVQGTQENDPKIETVYSKTLRGKKHDRVELMEFCLASGKREKLC